MSGVKRKQYKDTPQCFCNGRGYHLPAHGQYAPGVMDDPDFELPGIRACVCSGERLYDLECELEEALEAVLDKLR